jgi:TRAP-type C4-dicarboxylate transport system permease small subunit
VAERRDRAHQRDQVAAGFFDSATPAVVDDGRFLAGNTMDWGKLVACARWLRRRAENVSAALLLIMFLCFILTIVARYVFNYPLGWTEEASLIAWIWCTLWGAVFVLRERDEVRFDIFYSTASARTRCIFTVITGVAAIVLFGIALPAVVSYVTFLKVERSAYLGIRLDYLYSIYVLFSVGIIIRYAALTWRALRGHPPDIQIGSGSAL